MSAGSVGQEAARAGLPGARVSSVGVSPCGDGAAGVSFQQEDCNARVGDGIEAVDSCDVEMEGVDRGDGEGNVGGGGKHEGA